MPRKVVPVSPNGTPAEQPKPEAKGEQPERWGDYLVLPGGIFRLKPTSSSAVAESPRFYADSTTEVHPGSLAEQ